MKKRFVIFTITLSILFLIFCFQKLSAQDYLITFSGSGASTTVASVKVENLTQGTSTTVTQGNSLRLQSIITGNELLKETKNNQLIVYPNPMKDYSLFSFSLTESDETTIELYNISGKTLKSNRYTLGAGSHSFQIDNLSKGLYLLSVRTRSFIQTSKIISNGQNSISQVSLRQSSETSIQGINIRDMSLPLKSITSEVKMQYNTGDRIKYTGSSGNYSTVLTDIPTGNESFVFNFVQCTDGDGNNYPVVTIGTQTWMEENLKTTKNNDATSVPLVTDNSAWVALTTAGYCWYNNDVTTYKDTYGALYNWYTVNTGKLCPTGWHVPSDAEWTTLENYLIANGFNYDGTTTGNKYAKALASTTLWATYSGTGVVGNTDYPSKRNATGFTVFPGAYRTSGGPFLSIGRYSDCWSASEDLTGNAWGRVISYDYGGVDRSSYSKNFGFSVRCVRD